MAILTPELLGSFRTVPHRHQVVGVEALCKQSDPLTGRVYPGCFFLADEMGAGKTKQVIDAAQVLWTRGLIRRVIVIAPAPVRSVWFDPELGELAKHSWVPIHVVQYHSLRRSWELHGKKNDQRLWWTITNYDYVRDQSRVDELLPDDDTVLVLDEAAAVKNPRALQTQAVFKLRKRCGRVWLLNGTPIANSPMDLYAQLAVMDKRILGCENLFHFRARYAKLGGFRQRQVVGWRDLDDLQRRIAPYMLRRLKVDCLDLPPQLPPVTLTATLTAQTWAVYRELRDEFIVWLDKQTAAVAPQAAVKAMRLAQVTSGFLGGIQEFVEADNRPEWIPKPLPPREVGTEKLDVFMAWFNELLVANPRQKLLVWCRFRPELARLLTALRALPRLAVGAIHGGQKADERQHALQLLDPRTAPTGPAVVAGTPASGALGLNLTAADVALYMSNDYSLKTKLQSRERVHRPGQVNPVSYYELIAVGPQGQRTIDHVTLKALLSKEDVATWTCAAWRSELERE